MLGIAVADRGFQLVCDDWTGPRRHLDEAEVARLGKFASRYAELLDRDEPSTELSALGKELFAFLDGEGRHFAAFLDRARRPLHFEIATGTRRPSAAELALLRAPWELLANEEGFLAADVRLGFSPVRRLGRPEAPQKPDRFRLGVVFMAASPRGELELDYEAEETAIMRVVGATELDLLVEESGNPDRLAERIVELPAMQVLHLSCHGDNEWVPEAGGASRPMLALEDDTGNLMPTEAGTLIEALQAQPPRLVFLSACLTAAAANPHQRQRGAAVADSLAESLIDGGLPAVLGWDGSVRDVAATEFAATLYDGLAGQKSLANAVATARRKLLNSPETAKRGDWHLARLWLGPPGGESIVGGRNKRSMIPPTHGEKEFLIKQRSQVPVASHEMFVGRRRELQAALRALRDGKHTGVLLHGMGRLGKSSLAARIANRRSDLKLAVVFEHYGALDIMSALEEALRLHGDASKAVAEATRRVRENSTQLEHELTLLLSQPWAQTGEAPVLLVIDDLERILDWDADRGHHVVAPAAAPVMRAVLRAFDPAMDSRLIITSRHPLRLEGLEASLLDLPLAPLSPAAQEKLELRQRAAVMSGRSEKERNQGADLIGRRAELLARVPGISRGNPGLQDLIGRKLVLSSAVTAEHAAAALAQMEAWLAKGDLPEDARIREFLENLAVDKLIELAGAPGIAALRGLTLFALPVPEVVAEKIAKLAGESLSRLRDLGLVDVHEDIVDHQQKATAANALAAARITPLSPVEHEAYAREVAHELFSAWGGAEAYRPPLCDVMLTNLGLLAGDGNIVSACAAFAVRALADNLAKSAWVVGTSAIRLLDEQKQAVPLRLLTVTASAAAASGDGVMADELIARGVAMISQKRGSGEPVNEMEVALLFGIHAERLFVRGDLDEALRIRKEEQLPIYERRGDIRERAVTMANIAHILVSLGDLDEALRILREETLPIFEQLGNVHERAVTMGRIASILESRGDLEEALRILREEQLPVYERLGDIRERAVTMGRIANVLESRGDLDESLRIRRDEELPVYERIGDVRSHAVTMAQIADILYRRGEFDEALRIRKEQLPVFERLGDVRERAVSMGQIASILQSRGDFAEALQILKEDLLPVFERLGFLHERAVTMGRIAEILERQGKLDEARKLQNERLDFYRQRGDLNGIGAALWSLARLDLVTQDFTNVFPRITEAFNIVVHLKNAEGIAAIGTVLGQMLAAANNPEAVRVLQLAAAMSRKLGREDDARQIEEIIAGLNPGDPSATPP